MCLDGAWVSMSGWGSGGPRFQSHKVCQITRMVPGLGMGDLGYGERLGVLGLMALEERRNRSDMVKMFRVLKGLSAIPYGNIFWIEWKWQDQGKFDEDCKVVSLRIFKHLFSRCWRSFMVTHCWEIVVKLYYRSLIIARNRNQNCVLLERNLDTDLF